ncbi:hypothetical protein O3P69_010059 [Scylla paramamosain]|uniref:Uncharacterized protein n=1 Tax=Scylla paramamosain TaxID=85552 RepID=A0AAW0SNE0_SCYPA
MTSALLLPPSSTPVTPSQTERSPGVSPGSFEHLRAGESQAHIRGSAERQVQILTRPPSLEGRGYSASLIRGENMGKPPATLPAMPPRGMALEGSFSLTPPVFLLYFVRVGVTMERLAASQLPPCDTPAQYTPRGHPNLNTPGHCAAVRDKTALR